MSRIQSVVKLLWLSLLLPSIGLAQTPTGEAAQLYVYKLKEGMQQLFEEGYKRHLAWHRQHEDSLVWYGWMVTSGERRGYFINGTFGNRWQAFDERVDLAGDRADAMLNVAPYAEPISISSFRYRSDLSTSPFLEERVPTSRLRVFYYYLHPGAEHRFDEVIKQLMAALRQTEPAPPQAWYQLLEGGEYPCYVLMIPQQHWADYEEEEASLTAQVISNLSSTAADAALATITQVVRRVYSETWSYRADLSYFPEP